VIVPLLQLAGSEADIASLEELAEAASQTAYLLGVLRQAGHDLGVPPPHQVMVGLQGLRRWSLAAREAAARPPARPGP